MRLHPSFAKGSTAVELTTKGRYAVMAMADLALAARDAAGTDGSGTDRVGVGCVGSARASLVDIAERQSLSLSYLEQLFARLRRAGLVDSIRGPKGGYSLTRDASEISVSDIVAAVDESIQVTACSVHDAGGCGGRTQRCITHDLWAELTEHIEHFLGAVTLDDVVNDKVRGRAGSVAPTASVQVEVN